MPDREIEGLQRDLKLIEESCGTETINLVVARAYLLPSNNRLMRYLSHHHGDLLAALKTVAEEGTPEAEAAQPD